MSRHMKQSLAVEDLPEEFVSELRRLVNDPDLAALDHLMPTETAIDIAIAHKQLAAVDRRSS